MPVPDPQSGFTSYQKYEYPKWTLRLITLVLAGIAVLIVLDQSATIYTSKLWEFLFAVVISVIASLYIHESLHYIANMLLGYDPVFKWPNIVYVPDVPLPFREATVVLLAPQILSFVYILLLVTGVVSKFETFVVWGLILNLVGGSKDLFWVFRRATWPSGTKVVVSKDGPNSEPADYVSFPESES